MRAAVEVNNTSLAGTRKIYALADYDSSGDLLDLCRSTLSSGCKLPPVASCAATTSGYQTQDTQVNCASSRSYGRDLDHQSGCGIGILHWSQLIDCHNGSDDAATICRLAQLYAARIGRLCSSVRKLVG